MNNGLPFWADVATIVGVIIALLAWLIKPAPTSWFRAIRPFLPFIIVAAIFFWIGNLFSRGEGKPQLIEVTREIPLTVVVDRTVEVTRNVPVTQIVEETAEIPVTQIVSATPPALMSEGATTPVVPTEISSVSSPTPSSVAFEDNFERGYSNQWEIILGNPISVDGHLTSDTRTLLFVGDNSWKNFLYRTKIVVDLW